MILTLILCFVAVAAGFGVPAIVEQSKKQKLALTESQKSETSLESWAEDRRHRRKMALDGWENEFGKAVEQYEIENCAPLKTLYTNVKDQKRKVFAERTEGNRGTYGYISGAPQRTLRYGANIRMHPNACSGIFSTLNEGTNVSVIGYKIGEKLSVASQGVLSTFTSDIWFQVAGGYIWSGLFTHVDTYQLANNDAITAGFRPAIFRA